jgi:ABC-type uncharacterized transport system substrate-binding protein
MMRRREFITLLGGAAVAWPVAARGQQLTPMRRVGVLIVAYAQTDPEAQARTAAFLDTFQKLGWADGRNVRIEYRWGAGDADGGKAAALELVRSAPDVILVSSNSALAEVRRLTSSIPIVFTQISDPVGGGFVAGLARPGGNVTGFQNFEPAMGGKWLGVLKEAASNMSRAGVLFASNTAANVAFLRAAEEAAPLLGVKVAPIDVHRDVEIERAVATLASDAFGVSRNHEDQKIELAILEHRPRHVSFEFHQNVSRIPIPQYSLADWLRTTIVDPDVRLQGNTQCLRAGSARNQAALDGRHDRLGARSRRDSGWLVVFNRDPVSGNRSLQGSFQREKLPTRVMTDAQFAVCLQVKPRTVADHIKSIEQNGLPLSKRHDVTAHVLHIGDITRGLLCRCRCSYPVEDPQEQHGPDRSYARQSLSSSAPAIFGGLGLHDGISYLLR